MTNAISVRELTTQASEVMARVQERGESYVVSDQGQPLAAVVPLHVFEKYEESRRKAALALQRIRESMGDASEAEIEEEIAQALREGR